MLTQKCPLRIKTLALNRKRGVNFVTAGMITLKTFKECMVSVWCNNPRSFVKKLRAFAQATLYF